MKIFRTMASRIRGGRMLVMAAAMAMAAQPALAAEIRIVAGAVGKDLEFMREELDVFNAQTGHQAEVVSMPAGTTDQFAQYNIWLAAGTPDIDVYQVDVIWAPQLGAHLTDLKDEMGGEMDAFFPSIVKSQTVDGRLVAVPLYTDAPVLYYRKDLLDKHGKKPPQTWEEMTATAREIMMAERAAGDSDIWGFVFQGNAYEGLTCDALEWIKSHGGGQIVEPDGEISVNNPQAAKALELAKSWVGDIAPPGVLTYQEEEARGVWQTGNAVFMRNWPYAYSLGQGEDSKVRGKFDVVPLPHGGAESAATLGGWNLAVSKYSRNREAAVALVKFLTSHEAQKRRATALTHLPTRPTVYDEPEVTAAAPFFKGMVATFLTAVPRPSAPTKRKYNEVSKAFWTAAHKTLSGDGSAEDNLADLERKIKRIRGRSW